MFFEKSFYLEVKDLLKKFELGCFSPGQLSESEYEFEQKEVKLPQCLTTRGCLEGQKTNIR